MPPFPLSRSQDPLTLPDTVVCVERMPVDGDGDELFAVTFADGFVEPYSRRGIERSNLRYTLQAFNDSLSCGLDLALPHAA